MKNDLTRGYIKELLEKNKYNNNPNCIHEDCTVENEDCCVCDNLDGSIIEVEDSDGDRHYIGMIVDYPVEYKLTSTYDINGVTYAVFTYRVTPEKEGFVSTYCNGCDRGYNEDYCESECYRELVTYRKFYEKDNKALISHRGLTETEIRLMGKEIAKERKEPYILSTRPIFVDAQQNKRDIAYKLGKLGYKRDNTIKIMSIGKDDNGEEIFAAIEPDGDVWEYALIRHRKNENELIKLPWGVKHKSSSDIYIFQRVKYLEDNPCFNCGYKSDYFETRHCDGCSADNIIFAEMKTEGDNTVYTELKQFEDIKVEEEYLRGLSEYEDTP